MKTIIINSLNEPENNTSWQRDSLRIDECDPKRKSENAGAEDLRGLVSAASPIKKKNQEKKIKLYIHIFELCKKYFVCRLTEGKRLSYKSK